MFAHNQRISARQFKRLLTLELFGVTTVLLPGILCETVKRDGITALLGGMVLVFCFGILLKSIAKASGRSLQEAMKKKSRVLYEVFLFVMLIQMLLMGIWVLTVAAELSRDILMQGTDIRMVIVTFAVVSTRGAIKGMESRGRMAEVLYLFVLLPFLALLTAAAGKVNLDLMPPVLSESPKIILGGSYEVFIVFQGVMLGFFALPYLKKQQFFWKNVRRSVLLNVLFCLLLLGIAIGIFGINGAAAQRWLAVNLMTTPDFPGGLVERLDVLMVTIWIVSLYFFVSGTILHGGKMADRLFRAKREQTGILIVAALVIAGAILVGNREYSYYVYLNYMKYIGVPLVLFVLLLVLFKLRPKKALRITACLVLLLCLTGCAKGVELEDREFVLALGIDWDGEKIKFYYDTSDTLTESSSGDDDSGETKNEQQNAVMLEADGFYELQSVYGQQSDKYLDYNHLKAVIIGENLASDSDKLKELLQYVETNELFARNTKLFFTKEPEKIFELCQEADMVLGEYLEKMYVDSNYYVEGQSSSLGELLNHYHDSEELLLVPVLKTEGTHPLVNEYAIVRDVQWREVLQAFDAGLVYIGNGVSLQQYFTVNQQYCIELEKVNREIEFTGDSAYPKAKVTLKLRGRLVNTEVSGEKEKQEMGKALEEQLEELYKKRLTDWERLDVLHIYRALGSHNRQLWETYRNRRQEFDRRVQITVRVETTIV